MLPEPAQTGRCDRWYPHTRTPVMVQSPKAVFCGIARGADPPCCQFKATSSELAPGARKRISKYVVLVRLLPEKLTVTEPPSRPRGLSKPTLLIIGNTSFSDFKFEHGAFMDVIQVLFSNVFAPAADTFIISKPVPVISGTASPGVAGKSLRRAFGLTAMARGGSPTRHIASRYRVSLARPQMN